MTMSCAEDSILQNSWVSSILSSFSPVILTEPLAGMERVLGWLCAVPFRAKALTAVYSQPFSQLWISSLTSVTTKRSFSDQGQEQNISTNINVNIKKAIGQRVYLARIIVVGYHIGHVTSWAKCFWLGSQNPACIFSYGTGLSQSQMVDYPHNLHDRTFHRVCILQAFELTCCCYLTVECFLGLITISNAGKEQVDLSGKI